MIVRQLFEPDPGTCSRILADVTSREGVLMDPVFGIVRRDGALIVRIFTLPGGRQRCPAERGRD
jgi:hypothetical protein